MAEQKTPFLQTPGNGEWHIGSKAIPKSGSGELVVKIHATALNPVDWKIRSYNYFIPRYPDILVEDVGEGVQGFAKDDKVVHQGFFSNDKATFQQYTIVPAEITAKLPSNVSFDEVASVPLGLATAAVGLYGDRPAEIQKYTPVWEDDGEGLYRGTPIVVFGGSTSVGQYGNNISALIACKVESVDFKTLMKSSSLRGSLVSHPSSPLPHYTTPLSSNHSGRHMLLTVPAKAAEILGSTQVELICDAVSEEDTQAQAWDLLSPGGVLVFVLPLKVDKGKYEDKTVIDTVFGNVHAPSVRQLGVSMYSKLTRLLEDGTIKPNRVEVLPNGLAGIPDGLERLKVSGTKLIAHSLETA